MQKAPDADAGSRDSEPVRGVLVVKSTSKLLASAVPTERVQMSDLIRIGGDDAQSDEGEQEVEVFNTGDRVMLNQRNGSLSLTGRVDNMVKVRGERTDLTGLCRSIE